ncbi:MAG: MFS transporter [Gemmatimonadota bacterium]
MRDARDRRGPLERFLRLFADVRAGEGATVVLLALNVFLVLSAYYFVKPLRDALILEGWGAEVKSYSSALQALVLLGAVPAYGALAGRLPRRRLIDSVTAIFVACLVLFFVLGRAGVPVGVVFYVWVGIFNLMIVAQFWSFANDVYTNREGERLFPLVQFGASAGAVFGSVVVAGLIGPLGIWIPMLIAAGILLVSLLLTHAVDRRERSRTERYRLPTLSTATAPAATGEFRMDTGEFRNLREDLREALERLEAEERAQKEGLPRPEPEVVVEEPGAGERRAAPEPRWKTSGAFRLVFRTRYLLMIALIILLLNWVNTTGEYILGKVVTDAARDAVARGTAGGLDVAEYIGAFYGRFFFVVNLAGLLIQLFLVSRIIRWVGIRWAILALPLISLGAYGLLAFYPVISAVRWAKTAENATDYSLMNTVRQTLFLPMTREQKYKAKQAIDAFFWRAGDVLAAAAVFVGTTWLAMGAADFAKLNVVLIIAWVAICAWVGREYAGLVRTGRPPS